ncbi:hypothetical protein PR202_ga11037 [Eleusine coracana subsp. coracana]|uniref:Protein kinase domain-containing protein n=1 Tax=Eleusine coracana subsp. coracana TaxID=191504 RepID=A0AAV5C8K8_ELECO|nr:hypothetical protein PR202_ga11037 [Eleusine coracana subsp. coracana]
MYGVMFANFSGNHIGMESLANCAAAGSCTGNGIVHMVVHSSRRVLRAVVICVILAVIIVLILLVVYLRWKLLRRKPLALVPISKSEASVELTSSDELLGRKSRRPLSINVATFEHALLRFLIYEYMENGSLEMWLKNQAHAVEALGWPDRLKICLGSAYIAGTFGYIPPEYGHTMKSSTKGDVYSFGVIMLELLIGRPPTGQEEVEGGGNLVGWVWWMIGQGKENELFDPCLLVSNLWREQIDGVLFPLLGTARLTSQWKRPTLMEVVEGLTMAQTMECRPLVVKVSRDM